MVYKYLNYFPKPFLDDLTNDKCIPIIGAGFSKNANEPNGKSIPSWNELGKEIAKHVSDYQFSNAIDAISAYSHEHSRARLIEKLIELLLVSSSRPGEAHDSFCKLPFELVVTTNIEFLLEDAYKTNSIPCIPIVDEDQLSISNHNKGVSLLKFHGDLYHPKRLIVTEDDYDTFLHKYPMFSTYLASLLISKTALFIGYSLDDPDFRYIWQLIGSRLGELRRNAYTLRVNSPKHEISRFERRGVKVINLPGKLKNYSRILSDTFKEINYYWKNKILSNSTVTDEDTKAQLIFPSDVDNRLCFFAMPYKYLSFYKKYIFPIAEKYGFIPITSDEIITAEEIFYAKVSALIDRAQLIVVDLSSMNTIFELGMVLSQVKERQNILIIREEMEILPLEIREMSTIIITKDLLDDYEKMTRELSEWFKSRLEAFKSRLEDEPRRLLKKKEYRSAVISSMMVFEQKLRERLIKEEDIEPRSYSMLSMLKMSEKRNLIEKSDYPRLYDYIQIRNRLVHLNEDISHAEAEQIVADINSLLSKL